MPKKPSTHKPLINNNSTNATPKEKIPSFLIATTSGRNILSVLNLSILKEIAHLPIPLLLPLLSLTVSASRVKEKIPLMCHLKHLSSATSSSILNAREDSSPGLSIMPSCTVWLTPPAHLTTLPPKTPPKPAHKNWEIVKESMLEITVLPLNLKISSWKSSTMDQLLSPFPSTEISSSTRKDSIRSTLKTRNSQLTMQSRSLDGTQLITKTLGLLKTHGDLTGESTEQRISLFI